MACNSKPASRRAKRTDILDSGTLVTHIWGTFDLAMFNVILGSLNTIVAKWPVTKKRMVVEQNGLIFWTRGH